MGHPAHKEYGAWSETLGAEDSYGGSRGTAEEQAEVKSSREASWWWGHARGPNQGWDTWVEDREGVRTNG